MPFAWWLSLCVGFLSLSQEILWVRLVSFAFQGIPHAFSLVLANFLIGIAFGALVGKWFCGRSRDLHLVGAVTLLVAAVVDLLIPHVAWFFLSRDRPSLPWLPLAIIGTAAIKSVLFPIAHHLGSNQSGPKVGSSVSRIYFGNIVGSSLGPIVTGFFLLDRFTVEQSMTFVGLGCLALSVGMVLFSPRPSARYLVLATGAAAGLAAAAAPKADVIARIAIRSPDKAASIRHVIQNKHGIVHTLKDDTLGDLVYGGNIYDGRVSVDMSLDPNGLARAYVLAAAHPSPGRILVVGMGTGAWTRAVAGFPGVEHIDVVEINPAYLDLIRAYREVAPLLDDPRIHIHIDDGRRWLKRHPSATYDLIVQNTTYHWRSNTTNLLSVEYFREVRRHMRPGAIVAINTTSSLDVVRTAQEVFPVVFRFRNFVYGSDRDFRVPVPVAMQRLRACQIGDRPAFSEQQFEPGGLAYKLAHDSFQPVAEVLAQQPGLPVGVITDGNLLTEYRHGNTGHFRALRWLWPVNPSDARK